MRRRTKDVGQDAAAVAAVAVAKWEEDERGEERIGPVTLEYDHVQAAAELEAEEGRGAGLDVCVCVCARALV